MLDRNYLYHRYGMSLQMADNAACVSSRIAHPGLGDGYAEQIAFAKTGGARQW